jgi:hypothetical protein
VRHNLKLTKLRKTWINKILEDSADDEVEESDDIVEDREVVTEIHANQDSE